MRGEWRWLKAGDDSLHEKDPGFELWCLEATVSQSGSAVRMSNGSGCPKRMV